MKPIFSYPLFVIFSNMQFLNFGGVTLEKRELLNALLPDEGMERILIANGHEDPINLN